MWSTEQWGCDGVGIERQLLAALALDLLVGDPSWLPHPVRWMGAGALRAESLLRRVISSERLAGICAGLLVMVLSGLSAWLLLHSCGRIHPLVADGMGALLIYTTLAARDLARHADRVFRALVAGDLPEARRQVGMIVGRDTDELDEEDVTRAAVESIAESTVDGVTAPIFFALLFGPVGAIVYRAINTLDSTFGYRNERYLRFGWFSARIDDLANLVPARLTIVAAIPAAAFLGLKARRSLRMVLRDGRNHASPNSGLMEAAMAGALGVQLGGTNNYFGTPMTKPTIGDPDTPLRANHIPQACRFMFATSAVFAAVGILLRWMAVHCFTVGITIVSAQL
ncbi:MAG: cobalamin biosynthesis protein CobD [Lentisphaeria bacterium]|nr:cobalamin biosynthesis protein CobD [Lentisphaeria bacterium]